MPTQTEAFARLCSFSRHNGHSNANFDFTQCVFGWEIDACGHKVCTKGPGDLCGGKHQRYGICGEGLMCSNCNRCQGCSLKTFQCFDDRHCILANK